MKIKDLLLYGKIIKKRWWLPLLLVATTVGTIVSLSLLKEPSYVATVRFQVTAPPPGDVSLYQAFGKATFREEIAYTRGNFISILTSLDLAWRVIENLNLDMKGSELLEMTAVEPVKDSDFTEIRVSSYDPQLSANIANALITQGMLKYGEVGARGSTKSREFISTQLAEIGAQLEEAQQKLITFKIENRIGNLDDIINSQQDLIRSLRLARDQALAKSEVATAAEYDKLIDERVLEMQNLVQLGTEYARLQGDVNQLNKTYDFLLNKQAEAYLKENEALNLSFIQPLNEARVPQQAEPVIQTSIIVLGAVLSLVLGIVLVFIWEYLERQNREVVVVRNSEELLTSSVS